MSRETIDFGIDLGTTNSAIAVLRGADTEILKNNEDIDITPSVVWIMKDERMFVGRRAKDRLEEDTENAECEFKRKMGTDYTWKPGRSRRRFTPEELSAEVLKSLKADARTRLEEDVTAAVITVPAAFDLAENNATRRAAELAGITQSPLLQEPVAAALAYGFNQATDKSRWLVFDFGGGTFDCAVIEVKDGLVQVVNHGGDNDLGGKLIDWKVVEELFVPTLIGAYNLPDFRRGNSRWRSAFAKMKRRAEEAKIDLSRNETVPVFVENLCEDEDGSEVVLDLPFHRSELERLTQPLLAQAIHICRRALAEKRLQPSDISRVLLVGGPTKMPMFQECLKDPHDGLGISLESKIDPMTVVARGAAVFAGTQRVANRASIVPQGESWVISLEYQAVGPDTEPLVGGRVQPPPGQAPAGSTIELVRTNGIPWRSAKTGLSREGAFMVRANAERSLNTFEIELRDAQGTRVRATPDRFNYTVGLTIAEPPLTHSVGVAMANNRTDFFLRKGTPLPARARQTHRQLRDVRRGESGDLRIVLVEGECPIADGNALIGILEVPAKSVKRDVPAGAEIEITVSVDESRMVTAKAYIPILDEEFEAKISLRKELMDPEELHQEAQVQTERLEKLRDNVSMADTDGLFVELQRMEEEQVEKEIQDALRNADGDAEARQRAQERLVKLREFLNRAEERLAPRTAQAKVEETLEWVASEVGNHGTAEERRRLEAAKVELQRVLGTNDPELIEKKRQEILDLVRPILFRQPDFWVGYFHHLCEQVPLMENAALAQQLVAKGNRALSNNDLEALKAAVRQLSALLPDEVRRENERRGYGGTTGRF